VILVGEIRDLETAEIAIQASLTGHLVLSTLHTNDAATAVNRLVDMGVEPFLVASSLSGIMAQRLVRRMCPHCKEAFVPLDAELARVGIEPSEVQGRTVYRPHDGGCGECLNTGYKGRTGIYELLQITDGVRNLVVQSLSSSVIRDQAIKDGMRTLRADGARKFLLGETSLEEVMRITSDDSGHLAEDAQAAV
jgi:general secretion pathway protein E